MQCISCFICFHRCNPFVDLQYHLVGQPFANNCFQIWWKYVKINQGYRRIRKKNAALYTANKMSWQHVVMSDVCKLYMGYNRSRRSTSPVTCTNNYTWNNLPHFSFELYGRENVPTKQICQFHAEHFVHLCTIIFCPLIFLVGAVAMSSLWIFAWFQAAKWMVRNFGKTCWMNLEYGVSFHHLHFHAPLHHLYITPLCFERAQVPIADCRFVIYNMVCLPCF